MLNVNALQKTLSAMTLPQIQSYAQMHKDDPYVVSMALSIANTKKQAMIAQQGQAGQQQMPTVVDQDIAEIAPQTPAPAMGTAQLPEDTGIAQLPAQNIQGMAEGGIVAFGDGGEVPRFNGETGSVVPRPMQRIPGDPLVAQWDRLYADKYDPSGSLKMPEAYVRDPNTQSYVPNPALADMRETKKLAGLAAARENTTNTGLPETVTAPDTGRSDVEKTGITKLLPDTGSSNKGPDKAAYPALFQTEKMPDKAEYTKEYDELYKALDDKQAKFLENQKSKLKTDREEALYMAMIKGGLAAAAGTSQYGITNIAKGFGEGAEDFNASLKDFRKAAQETAKIELEMDRAQADRKAGRMDKYDAKVDKAKEMALERDKALLAANTQLQAAGITAGAHMAAAQLPPKEAQMAALLGTGKTFEERFQSGLPKLTAIQAGKFDPRKAYTDYLVAAQRSGTGEIMSFPEFAMQFGPRVSGGAAAGQVLERKD